LRIVIRELSMRSVRLAAPTTVAETAMAEDTTNTVA
jgi:hypothetical protein